VGFFQELSVETVVPDGIVFPSEPRTYVHAKSIFGTLLKYANRRPVYTVEPKFRIRAPGIYFSKLPR
jgi:hypothetical protein